VILFAILLGAPIGTGAIVANAVAQIPGIAWGLVVLFLSLSFLGIAAVFRFEGRAPPRAEGVDSDRSCRRLKVHNPNEFTLEDCYVALKQAKVISSDAPAEPPGQQFHFAWGSWQFQGSGLKANLPPKTDRFVDLVGLREQDSSDLHFYHHTTSGDNGGESR